VGESGGGVMFRDDRNSAYTVPIQPEWVEIARQAWPQIRLALKTENKNLAPEWRARGEIVLFIADKLRQRGVERPIEAAWKLIGFADAGAFDAKTKTGEPLGDLSPKPNLDKYAPLIWSRLKHFRVAGDEDCQQAAQLGLLNALADYNPAIDGSVGTFAELYFYIDKEIKAAMRGKDADAWAHDKVSGGEIPNDDSYEGDGETNERWEAIAKAAFSDDLVHAIEAAHDDRGRFHVGRLSFQIQMWLAQTSVPSSGARVEPFMDLPATPQQMAEWLSSIPETRIAPALAKLSERAREIITARFYSKPATLLDEVARGDLDRKRPAKVSYKEVIKIAHRALGKIAGKLRIERIETIPNTSAEILKLAATPLWEYPSHIAIRRPMRQPPPPCHLETVRYYTADFRHKLSKDKQLLWADSASPTKYGTRLDRLHRLHRANQKALANLDFDLSEKLTERLEGDNSNNDTLNLKHCFDDTTKI
jgi:DNA-directed RNA polymerase specialized sigma subunit